MNHITVLWSIVLVGAAMIPGATAPPPAWGTIPGPDAVPSGMNISFTVFGPPHGTFQVQVFVEPFNATVPVSSFGYRLPDPSNGTGYAFENVSVATRDLGIGLIEVAILNVSVGTFANQYVHLLLPPDNLTAVQSEIAYVYALYNATHDQNINLLQQMYRNDAHAYSLYDWSIGWMIFWTLAMLFIAIAPKTRLATTAWWDVARQYLAIIGWRKGFSEPGHGVSDPKDAEPGSVLSPRTDLVYVCDVHPGRPSCRAPRTLSALFAHLQAPSSKGGAGLARPVLGLHYSVDVRERKGALSMTHGMPGANPARAVSTAVDPKRDALKDLRGL